MGETKPNQIQQANKSKCTKNLTKKFHTRFNLQAVNDKRKSGINNKSKLKPIRICGLNYYYFLKNKTGILLCLYFIALDPVSSITVESNITVSLQFSSVNWDWT